MNIALETSILERLRHLDAPHQAEVLDFVEFLASRSASGVNHAEWKSIDPSHDLAKFVGDLSFPEDGVAYQRRIRDTEWP